MTPEARKHINNAIKIAESLRYKIGVNEFIKSTVDHWAFNQTGLYPPGFSSYWDEETNKEAINVSIELSSAMRIDPVADVLGWYLSETGYSKDTQSFYPTPPEISRLMAMLINTGSKQNKYNHYECCSGTGILTLSFLDDLLNKEGEEALSKVSITLEDINPTIVKCCLIQILHYLDVRSVNIKKMKLETVDVISRKICGPVYVASSQREPDIALSKQTRGAEAALFL